jgi:hypothetical protein
MGRKAVGERTLLKQLPFEEALRVHDKSKIQIKETLCLCQQ